MSVTSVDTERNYVDMLNGTASTGKTYNAVFGDSSDDLSVQDFFNMMVMQLTHQDFMNPVDDTQYLAQMAQFATMQEMMDLCQYSKQNYVMGMLGRSVTISKNDIGGGNSTITGKVEKIVLDGDDYKIYVNGQPYDYSKVSIINDTSVSSDSGSSESTSEEPAAETDV
ncbi:MAG: flagellar hook assembly protein FlgD [Porcipelethomonas sp.]